ncbi:MAG TPA: carbamoyltransferase HypF [Scandinavium sp.]|jgi:hydrogenase maturation protein HypF|uniref:carbamoyltransferase HypF n=1 Tax=Scandinavium sp. TaxID=2830653 RepID=UPI002E340CCE|nr:carbamoyltransferase HypF [Scandinavium sp.]HEX4502057.1 carbamoyltransferase HypF [Scandinavium sp.]
MPVNGIVIRVRGKVQGVGFRPFVWQIAQQLQRQGNVSNDAEGVLVHLVGAENGFPAHLRAHCPVLARIDSTDISPYHWGELPTDFTIQQSGAGRMSTQIVPDAATCPACLAEMNDPQNRRYRYPFINCTHCGPRFTIIHAMPYDRPFTVMAAFPLCPSCEKEYRDPRDRRFHAQPVACAECGPQLSWRSQAQHETGEAALNAAVRMLASGGIVAIKSLGGFHLACDAGNANAVARLRQRKRRPAKPLAVMLAQAGTLPEQAQKLLNTPASPIVLVTKKSVADVCDGIAPGLDEVGVMLPSNPIQHLLMQALNRPLVMTSGNLNGKPPATSNAEALGDLAGIADGFLLHNRDIVQRMDDSVMRQNGEILRRARGFVPDALPLPPGFVDVPPLLCCGADLKNTFCLVRGKEAVLSQHLGDLAQGGVETQWGNALALMQSVYAFTPERVVVDAHEGYRSVQWGKALAIPCDTVLHHHAHAAACMAEHGWPLDGGDVIALTLDGIGMGENGALWGGECLKVNYRECAHLGGLPAVALPGGDLAARQPWRNLLAQSLAFTAGPEPFAILQNHPSAALGRAVERGINAPLASSCGRLFDAVASALTCAPDSLSYEGEAACLLEALAWQSLSSDHPLTLPFQGNELNLRVFWQEWLNWSAPQAEKAWAFHDALACGFAQMMRFHAEIHGISTLVFGGGVLHNRLLRERLAFYLSGFTLLFPRNLPAGDGGISYGQAVIAAARLQEEKNE